MTASFSIDAYDLLHDLDEIARSFTDDEVRKVTQAISIQAFVGFVLKTPVDKGRARGGWTLEVGQEPAINGNPRPDKSGNRVIGKAQTALAAMGPYEVVYAVNDVPYIGVLDQGQFEPENPGPTKDKRRGRKGRVLVRSGFSVQAPEGMVDVTLQEIRAGLKPGVVS